jgi:folate-binding protein YgfZ
MSVELGDGPGGGPALAFEPPSSYAGGFEGEYRTLTEGCGLLDLRDFASLAVEGPKRADFLQRILSQDIASLGPGRGAKGALLDPKGHILTLLRILVAEQAISLEAPRARLDALEAELVRYKVGTPVRFRREAVALLGLAGPGAEATLLALGAPSLPPEGHAPLEIGGFSCRVSATSLLPGGGFVVSAPEGDASRVRDALRAQGGEPVGRKALDVARIEHGRAWFGPDVTEGNLLHEVDAAAEYHSTKKGCYIGQEVIARLEARGGNVNKKLRVLKAEAPLPEGARLRKGDEDAGVATSVAVSPRFGPLAIALVRRPFFEPGTTLSAEGIGAEVVPPPAAP